MTRIFRHVVLYLGALVFIFPFYYMLVSSFQAEPDVTLKGLFPTSGYTLDNYTSINDRVNLLQSLANSGIFTAGVLLGTVVFGILAGYACSELISM